MKNSINFEEFKQRLPMARYKSITVSSMILSCIKFKRPNLKDFSQELSKKKLKFSYKQQGNCSGLELTNTNEFKSSLTINNKIYDFGLGGLHSRNKNEIYRADAETYLIDVDVASYYPSLMINYKFKPDFLSDKWLQTYAGIREERLKAKKDGNKIKANALKIVLNSIYGKFNSIYFYAHDPKTAYSVTINGQLILLKLIEMFELAGMQVVSANTDGVTVFVKKRDYSTFKAIKSDWEKMFKLELEENYYSILCMDSVNDYFAKEVEYEN